jgi:hypothetical protein
MIGCKDGDNIIKITTGWINWGYVVIVIFI